MGVTYILDHLELLIQCYTPLLFFNKKDIVSANYIAAGLNATTNKQLKSTSKCLVLLE
jgi:hypothetical protein